MTAPTTPGYNDGTAALRVDIERTRGDMSRTVNEIEERLSPSRIKEQLNSVTSAAKEQLNSVTSDVLENIDNKVTELKGSIADGYKDAKVQLKDDIGRELTGARNMVSDEITHARAAVREATVGRVEHMVHDARESVTDAGTSVIDTIKANPLPAALIGVGLGWLIFGARSSAAGHFAQDAGHRVAEVAGGARDTAVQYAGEARDTAAHFADDARVRGERALRGAGRQVMRAERGVESQLRENPLALGAVAVAIGAAIGLSLPHTQTEDQWMGAAKDRLIHQAEGAAGEAIHKAEAAVGQLTSGDDTKKDGPITNRGLSNGQSGPASSNGYAGPSSSSAV
jgi:uncharacterized protein YjbJ (UPF0337 family)